MSTPIDIIKAANRKETRRVPFVIPIDEQSVTFYVAAKDTYQIWADQRESYWAEHNRLSQSSVKPESVDAMAANINASTLMREILPKYFRNEDGSAAYKDEAELQEIIDLISSDGDALSAVSEGWVKLTSMVTRSTEAAKNL